MMDIKGVNRALNEQRKKREKREKKQPVFKRVTAAQIKKSVEYMLVYGTIVEIVIQDDRGGNGGFLMKITPGV